MFGDVNRTSVPNAEAYSILTSPNPPGPYTTFKEFYAPRNFPAPNEVTLTDLIEGDMYFLKVLSGNAIGEFETVGSPIVVAIPTLSVRTAAKNLFVEAYDATFVRISWEVPGGDFTGSNGPAASHFAVAYRCDVQAGPIVYPQEYTSTTATVYASFTMGRSCQVSVTAPSRCRRLFLCSIISCFTSDMSKCLNPNLLLMCAVLCYFAQPQL